MAYEITEVVLILEPVDASGTKSVAHRKGISSGTTSQLVGGKLVLRAGGNIEELGKGVNLLEDGRRELLA